jgi:hypothetical protein
VLVSQYLSIYLFNKSTRGDRLRILQLAEQFQPQIQKIGLKPATKMTTTVRVGAVQAEPVWLDLNGSVEKTISLIESAASDGVKVLGFPEVWIPGYPW